MDTNINDIIELLSLEFHRFKRYATATTLVVIETESEKFFPIASSGIRKLDHIAQISTNLYAIVYAHTGLDGAQAAMDNIFAKCQDFEVGYRVGMCEVDKSDMNELAVVKRTFEKIEQVSFIV